MTEKTQSFENHAKFVPGYHFLTTGLVAVLLFWAGRELVLERSLDSLMEVVLVVAILMTGFYARTFALGVQDRVIRLEEKMRLERLLPDDLKGRVNDFTTEQLIGLRFASDGELTTLARRVLDEGISDRKTIKAAIGHWRADNQRI